MIMFPHFVDGGTGIEDGNRKLDNVAEYNRMGERRSLKVLNTF